MPRLDQDILEKMARKLEKTQKYLREQISRKASKQGISSPAAQLMWARELGFGIGRALNKHPEVRAEIQGAATAAAQPATRARSWETKPRVAARVAAKEKPITAATIKTLLKDPQLHTRCKDLILANKHFDRAFREATTVLDDRLKKKTGIKNMNPANLVGKALNPNPTKAVIEVSADKAEQEGMYSICKGIMLAFRDKTHHTLSDRLTREDALTFCGFIDTILGVIETATIHKDRV